MSMKLTDSANPASNHATLLPSAWVQRFASLIAPGARVLDLACGHGRHSRWLADQGYQVEAVDRDAEILAGIQHPLIHCRCTDLEAGEWPYHSEVFGAIVVTNYLWRPLLPQLLKAVDQGGVLIYETFMIGNERFGKPSNPAFLLRSSELLDLARGRMRVVAFEQGEVASPRVAMVQRLCAVRALSSVLPAP